MSELSLGIIGAGALSERHAVAIGSVDGLSLAAVRSHRIARAKEFSSRHSAIKSYEEIEYMLDDGDIDGIVAITALAERAEAIKLALKSGRPVIAETPLSDNPNAIKELISISQDECVPIIPVVRHRFSECISFMKSVDIGKIIKLSVSYIYNKTESAYKSERESLSPLYREGYEPLDVLLYLGGKPQSLSSVASNIIKHSDYDDAINAIFRFQSGALGSFELISSAYRKSSFSVDLYGEKGTLYYENGVLSGYVDGIGEVELKEKSNLLSSFYGSFLKSMFSGSELESKAEDALLVSKVIAALHVN